MILREGGGVFFRSPKSTNQGMNCSLREVGTEEMTSSNTQLSTISKESGGIPPRKGMILSHSSCFDHWWRGWLGLDMVCVVGVGGGESWGDSLVFLFLFLFCFQTRTTNETTRRG